MWEESTEKEEVLPDPEEHRVYQVLWGKSWCAGDTMKGLPTYWKNVTFRLGWWGPNFVQLESYYWFWKRERVRRDVSPGGTVEGSRYCI